MALGLSNKAVTLSSSMGLNLSRLVPKVTFVNVDEGKTLKVMLNPTTIRKGPLQAVYTQHNVIGCSHPLLQYQHSSGVVWQMQLLLHATSSGGQSLINFLPLSRNISKDAAFLESLTYPLKVDGLTQRQPPHVRFVVPGWVNQTVVMLRVGSLYKAFNAQMRLRVAAIDIAFAETPPKSVTCSYIRKHGASGRPGLLGMALDAMGGFGDAIEKTTQYV